MNIYDILSLNGKTIYVINETFILNEISPNTYVIVPGKYTYSYTKYTIEEIRFPNDEKELKVMFVYNFKYDDCYNYFVPNQIGKSVFFTEEEVKNKIDTLKSKL